MPDESRPRQFRPEQRGDAWYVAQFFTDDDTRVPYSGMNTSWTLSERDKALGFANLLNRANRRAEAD